MVSEVFKSLVSDPDMWWVFIDGSYAKVHQHSAGAAEAMAQSRAGNTSKIHMAVAARGWAIDGEHLLSLKHYRAVASDPVHDSV